MGEGFGGKAVLLERLSKALEALPGVGRRSAERMADFLARRGEIAKEVVEALVAVREGMRVCPSCGGLTERGEVPCRLCVDPRRDDGILCVVEQAMDIELLEQSGAYGGRYFALMGRLSPMRGEGPGQLRVEALLERAGGVKEVLLAMNSDVEGDATAAYLREALLGRHPGLKVTRLAFGLPAGSGLAYADSVTLARAIRGRMGMG